MAYIRYKEVTKHFHFKKEVSINSLPNYVKDYVYEDEILLAAYKVGKDHGIITDKKIVLFDNSQTFGIQKEITTIPYRSITAHSIIFQPNSAKIYLLLETSNPLLLKFANMSGNDKRRLRLIYNAMSSAVCNQKISRKILSDIINNR